MKIYQKVSTSILNILVFVLRKKIRFKLNMEHGIDVVLYRFSHLA